MKARTWYPATVLALMVIASIVAGRHMPDRVVTHYDRQWRPNGYGSKYSILLVLPIITLFISGVLYLVRGVVASPARDKHVDAVFDRVLSLALTVFLALHVSILARTLGHPVALERLTPAIVGLIFIAIGPMLPGIPRNPVVGVRTPWTLRSDRVWDRSQIIGSRLMIAAGVVSILASALPTVAGLAVAISSAIAVTIAVTVYSYIAWKRESESSR